MLWVSTFTEVKLYVVVRLGFGQWEGRLGLLWVDSKEFVLHKQLLDAIVGHDGRVLLQRDMVDGQGHTVALVTEWKTRVPLKWLGAVSGVPSLFTNVEQL